MHPELVDTQTEITAQADGAAYTVRYEDVPLRTVNSKERMSARRMADIPYTGDQGIRLGDVYHGTHTMEEFVAQLSDNDLICLFRGEGMCSPKVTPGTGAAFGGLTESLRSFGIPGSMLHGRTFRSSF